MGTTNGKIGVTSENIFPIIKRFLYSDHEIFLRELVSNAVDATQKIRLIAKRGECDSELGDLTIRINVDKEARTLTIHDAGIGMTDEEVDKFINQIALSGATSFLEKYKDEAASIIGHFGLGFYSAFMVAERVEIDSLSYQTEAKPVHWVCNGAPEYQMEEGSRSQRGTSITLHIAEDSSEFLEDERIDTLLTKYCRFLPVPIVFGKKRKWEDGKEVELPEDNVINSEPPIWTSRPADLKEEDYDHFYKALYPNLEEPLFHIHLNVDYPFNLTGILYFPKIRNHFDIQRNRIQLYCNQVFVTDSVEGIVPEYLTLLHGVLDSPDIPLNVSRSYLQSDASVKKIAQHITKKVADRLAELLKNDRKGYEAKWSDLRLFVAYGMISDEKFYERSNECALLASTDGNLFTIPEYRDLIKEAQTDANGDLIYLYATDKSAQWAQIEAAKAKGYNVLLMDGQLDAHLINLLERQLEKTRFARVDSDIPEKLIKKGEVSSEMLLGKEACEAICYATEGLAESKAAQISVSVQPLGENALPAIITRNEFMRRMHDMQSMGPSSGMMMGDMGANFSIVLNGNHTLVQRIWEQAQRDLGDRINAHQEKTNALNEELATIEKPEEGKEIGEAAKARRSEIYSELNTERSALREEMADWARKNRLLQQIYDLALLSDNQLQGEALSRFVARSVEIVTDESK